jgi:uncharacterized damage-inducible protein DinB
MYRRIDDFLSDWDYERSMTSKMLHGLTDESLGQAVADDHFSLGSLAWHLVVAQRTMLGFAGLTVEGPERGSPQPASAAEIAAAYDATAESVGRAVQQQWSDDDLPGEIPMFRLTWTRGATLSFFVRHQTHHRGQMTVLMRQAGLQVPGVYGPSREERAAMLAAAPAAS